MATNDQMMPTKHVPMGRYGSNPLQEDPDAAQEGMEPNDSAAEEEAEAQRKRVEMLLSLRLKDAIDARSSSGIEEIWLEDQDQYDGIDDVTVPMNVTPAGQITRNKSQITVAQRAGGSKSRVYLNITKPKTDVGVSRVQEQLVPHDDKPWEVGPTPIPELAKAVSSQDETPVRLADGNTAPAKDVAKAMMIRAESASERMQDQIEDWFVEGSVYSELRKVIRYAGRIGTGVLTGPIPAAREVKKWSMGQDGVAVLQSVAKVKPTSKCISPWDLFPDPSCGENIHDGAFVFRRDYLTGRRLRELAKLPEYDPSAIADCLREGPQKRSRYDDRQSREQDGQTNSLESDTYEVFYYYGDLPPEELLSGGWKIAGFNDGETAVELAAQIEEAVQLSTVSIVATMVNEKVVRVSLNPLETGEFPFDVFTWEPVDNQPWGRGIPRKMATAQKMLNASTRAMLENAGMSAGPQVVIDRDRITPANGVYEISGRKLWYWTPGDEVKDVRFAFTSVMIESAQEQLQAIIEFSLRMADELSSMPLLLQGIVGNAAPETLGGQAMAEANATSPLRAIAKQFDDQIIVPHLTRYHSWAMQDPEVAKEAKDGDLKCRARGASTLIYRDSAAQFLPQLTAMVADPRFKINPEKWIAEVLRGNKVNPETIQYTEEESKAIADQQAKEPPPQDPRIESAKIKAASDAEDRKLTQAVKAAELQQDAQESQLDRENELIIKTIEREIQVMEFAGNKQMSLDQLRGLLASKAMEIRNKREMFAAEREFALGAGHGRGL
jgi:hypothetical protein